MLLKSTVRCFFSRSPVMILSKSFFVWLFLTDGFGSIQSSLLSCFYHASSQQSSTYQTSLNASGSGESYPLLTLWTDVLKISSLTTICWKSNLPLTKIWVDFFQQNTNQLFQYLRKNAANSRFLQSVTRNFSDQRTTPKLRIFFYLFS